jgi:hypothetical protein
MPTSTTWLTCPAPAFTKIADIWHELMTQTLGHAVRCAPSRARTRIESFLASDRAAWYNHVNIAAHPNGGHFIPWEIPEQWTTDLVRTFRAAPGISRLGAVS